MPFRHSKMKRYVREERKRLITIRQLRCKTWLTKSYRYSETVEMTKYEIIKLYWRQKIGLFRAHLSRAVVYVSIDSGNDIRLTQLVVICLTFPSNKTGKARLKFSMFERDFFFSVTVTQAGTANRSQSYDVLVTRPDALPISYRWLVAAKVTKLQGSCDKNRIDILVSSPRICRR